MTPEHIDVARAVARAANLPDLGRTAHNAMLAQLAKDLADALRLPEAEHFAFIAICAIPENKNGAH